MKYTYTNTRGAAVRVFTPAGPLLIPANETITLDAPLSSAPYWVMPVPEEGVVKEEVVTTTETTVICSTTVGETTKARRRKATTKTTVEQE